MKALSIGMIVGALLCSAPTSAEEATPAAPPQERSDDLETRARACFRRGIQLYEERDFNGAGVEFRRAYELARSFRILFNLGRVAVEQHDYASAIALFARYLDEGGDQVPVERQRELREEMVQLRSRVGQIRLAFDEPGADVYVDDVLMGRTPLGPLTVNVGRRRLEVRPKRGLPEVRVIDAVGEETTVVRIAVSAPLMAPEVAADRSSRAPVASELSTAVVPKKPDSTVAMVGWSATGICLAGAAVFGVLAYRSAADVKELRDRYPASREDLDDKRRATRTFSAVADGLLGGAVVLGALSLYYSFDREPNRAPAKSRVSVGLSWPASLTMNGRF